MYYMLVSAEGKWLFWYTLSPSGYHFEKRDKAKANDPEWFKENGYTVMLGRNGFHYVKVIELR